MNKLNDLVDRLEHCSILLWSNDLKSFLECYSELISLIMECLPFIIMVYSYDSMSDYSSDALYWPMQVNKIVGLVDEKCDFWKITDALYFEFRENIVALQKTMEERNIIVEGLINA